MEAIEQNEALTTDDLDDRIVSCAVHIEFLQLMMTKGFKSGHPIAFSDGECECMEGLPDDAVFVRAFFDNFQNIFYLVFRHPSFEKIDKGAVIPEQIKVTYKRTT